MATYISIGSKITKIRPMTKKERDAEGWDSGSTAIEFDCGAVLYASCDEEGNNHGEIFGYDKKSGQRFGI